MFCGLKMWKVAHWICLIECISLFTENALSNPAQNAKSTDNIIFPSGDYPHACVVDESRQINGTCQRLADCPIALERWKTENKRPPTCYFIKFDHYVCCDGESIYKPSIETQPPPLERRRSELECDAYFVIKTSVFGGIPTKPQEFPYMVALGWPTNADNLLDYRCGGVLVADTFVLTAAHCAKMGGDNPTSARIGGVNLTDASVEDVPIQDVIIHPGYNVSSAYNDIALVKLAQAVSNRPACIWSRPDVVHNNATALGYGHTRFAGAASDQLLKAPLFLMNTDACQQFYPADDQTLQMGLTDMHICAGDQTNRRDTCQGDSGGPLMQNVEDDVTKAYVVGITSFGQACAGQSPGVYTRTSAFIGWLENVIWNTTLRNIKI